MRLSIIVACFFATGASWAGTLEYVSGECTHVNGWPFISLNRFSTFRGYTDSDFYDRSTSYYAYGDFGDVNPAFDIVPAETFHLDRDNITVTFTIRYNSTSALDVPGKMRADIDTLYKNTMFYQVLGAGNFNAYSEVGRRSNPILPTTYIWDGLQLAAATPTPPTLVEDPSGGSYWFYRRISVNFGSWIQVSPLVWETSFNVPYDVGTIEFDIEQSMTCQYSVANDLVGTWKYRLAAVNGSPL